MPLIDFISVLYEETPIEVCLDYEPVYVGTVEGLPTERFLESRVKEAYISLSGDTLIIAIAGQRNVKKK